MSSEHKKRIMWCGEASFLSTGYSTYGKEVLSRLHDTGKYELHEFSSFGHQHDGRAHGIPWGYTSVMWEPGNEESKRIYHMNSSNKYGEWKFEEACVRFRPDIVVDIRDWWMLEFEQRSPFRKYFHWAIMPTVDAEPQDEQWIATYMDADGVFTYSDWGLEQLKLQAGNKINLQCSAPPGADLKSFGMAPDKRAHKERAGLDPDCLIVGTIMRNQRRKLYPNLIQDFHTFLKRAPKHMADKTTLYLHTAWPDIGWDIPRLIKEEGIGHKVIFTYHCRDCNAVYPSYFHDNKVFCPQCGSNNSTFPTSHIGISRGALANIINCFDVYVQYANSEGFGMPQVEAASCGVNVFATDYSAMSDVVRKVRGVPVKVAHKEREVETHCYRAIPCGDDFVEQLITWLSKPLQVRHMHGSKVRDAVAKHYNWDDTAKKWEEYFDGVKVKDHKKTWLSPANYHDPSQGVPQGLNNESFVRWCIAHVAGRPDLVDSYLAMRITRDLNWETAISNHMGGEYFNEASAMGLRPRTEPFNRKKAYAIFHDMAMKRNNWEKIRSDHANNS